MNNKKNIVYFLSALIIIISVLSGCNDNDGSGHIFKMNINSNPENLDPQLATDDSSIMVLGSMFRGLFKLDSAGVIQNDTVESYTVSPDGYTYTFKIKDGIVWEGIGDYSAPLTANDFEYAFKRIYDSKTSSPYEKTFKCIKNAISVNKGQKSLDELGVVAEDDNTLIISLEYPYYNFINLLTLPASYPCNEDFFVSTKGRYGLSPENCISNGAFYIKEWNYDKYWDNNYIILKRNKFNSENDRVYPAGLNFFIKDKQYNDTDYTDAKSDCLMSDESGIQVNSTANCYSYQNVLSGILINKDSDLLSNINIRKALTTSIDRQRYSSDLPDGFEVSDAIIPSDVTIMNKKVRDLLPDSNYSEYDNILSGNLWSNELYKMNISSVEGVSIMVNENYSAIDAIRNIAEQWQTNLDFICNVEVVSDKEYNSRIKSGEYDMIVVEDSIATSNIEDCFSFFVSGGDDNTFDYFNSNLNYSVNQIETARTLNDAVNYIQKAESVIIDDSQFIPVAFNDTYFYVGDNISDVEYSPFKRFVDFSKAKLID